MKLRMKLLGNRSQNMSPEVRTPGAPACMARGVDTGMLQDARADDRDALQDRQFYSLKPASNICTVKYL